MSEEQARRELRHPVARVALADLSSEAALEELDLIAWVGRLRQHALRLAWLRSQAGPVDADDATPDLLSVVVRLIDDLNLHHAGLVAALRQLSAWAALEPQLDRLDAHVVWKEIDPGAPQSEDLLRRALKAAQADEETEDLTPWLAEPDPASVH